MLKRVSIFLHFFVHKPWLSRKSRKVDFAERDAANRQLGKLGEQFVFDLEHGKRECQYWIRIIRPDPRQGDNNPYFPFVHRLDRNPKWSHGYNPMPVLKNKVYRKGPFSTRAEVLAFYESIKMSLPGAQNRKEIEYTED